MKNLILTLSIILLFLTAGENLFANNKQIIKNPDTRLYLNNNNQKVELTFPYFEEGLALNKMIKVFDLNNKAQDINIYRQGSWLIINGDLKKDINYKIKIKGIINPNPNIQVKYDYAKNFIFKSEELKPKNIYRDIIFNDLKSAHFILTFNSGDILTKDIRNYIEFIDKIDYSYLVKRNRLYIYGDFKPNKEYLYTLKKGFEAGSAIAKDDIKLKASFEDISRNLKFTSYKSYVSSYSEAVDIQTTNIEAINVEIIKVNKENLNYLNLFKKSYFDNKYYQDEYNFKSIGETIQKYKKAISYEQNKTITSQLSFNDKLLHEEDGIYLILIKDNKNKYKVDSKLIFKSDLGISAKVANNQMFFSIRSLASNKSIANADIWVYSKNNKLLFKGKTNSDGIYKKAYQNIVKSYPKLVIVKKDEQINFLNLSDSISSYDILNDNIKNQTEYDSLIFMERTLLRPNDSVNMLITVKNKDFKSLKNQTIYLQFIDPMQKELFTQKLILNEAGIAEYKFTSFNNYKTGKYRINVLLGKEQIAYKEFYVEAFIPEKIEVKVKSSKDKYFANEKINFDIKSKYLFGTPASALAYDIEVISNAATYVSKDFKDYSFENFLEKDKTLAFSNINESGKLDENGYKNFSINLKLNKTSNSLIKTSLIATVFDDGRAVQKFKDVDVYPFDTIVGITKEFEGTVKTDEEVSFNTILLNPMSKTKIATSQRLKVRVFKKYYHYYAGEEIREVENFSINSNEKIKVRPKESGEYYVLVETNKGQISSETFYASGWTYDPVNIKDKSSYKISIKTNKELYKQGDNISIDLKSPISGKLLLTLEEDEILDYKVIELTSNTAVLNIPMNNKIKKGAYIKAQIIRSTETSDDIFPFRVIGSTYIKKDNSDKKLNVEINSKNLYKSGQEVEIKVSTNPNNTNSYAVVSMVDMGILNIINEKPINAFEYYDKKNKDNISLYDLYSNLQKINILKSEPSSGDGIKSMREKHISPDAINQRVEPLSFWSKIIKLDKNGTGIAKFKLTNFNGQVLIQALIINDLKIGSSNKKVTIKDNIVIKPTLPRFFIKNDEARVPLRLLNTTNQVQKIKLFIQSSSNLSIGKNTEELVLNPKQSKVLEVKINALEEGLSKLIFKISKDEDNLSESFINETSIYVKDKFDYKLISKSGIINKQEIKKIKIIDEDTKKLNTEVKAYLGIDNSPFTKLSKSTKYLISYPHGCAEQTSSQVLAMLMSKKFIDKKDKKLLFEREVFIKEGIHKLLSMQNSKGMFTYWSGGYYVNNYASFYTTYVLKILSENGFNIPKNALKKAFEAHWDIFKKEYKDLDFFSIHASKRDTNMIYDNNMYGDTLTSYIALAVSMKRYENDFEYKTLIEKAKKYFKNYDMDRQREYSQSFYSPIKDIASSLYLYSKYINNDLEDDFSKDLLRTLNQYINDDKLYSTQDKAFVMLALTSYYKNLDTSNTKINAIVKYENELENIEAKSYKKILVKNKDSLSINNQGGVLNYILDINKPLDLEVNSKKISELDPIYMKADIINDNGKVIDYNNLKLGNKLFMKVTIKSNKKIENVAVNIQIPAGLEIINPRLYKSNSQKFKNIDYSPDYEDYRDDRVLSYLTTTKKKKIFYIPLIATTRGIFTYPASYIEVMYDSRINSYYKPSKKIIIK